jgi:hypothetical protein
MKYLFEVHRVLEYAADHVKTKFFQSVIQYPQKVLTGIPMTLISFVDVVGCSNLFAGSYVYVHVVYQISAS